jgi:hypothetical protein
MNRRMFLSALGVGVAAVAAAQVPAPVPVPLLDILYNPNGGRITFNAANGCYTVKVDAAAYGQAGGVYVAQASVVDANGTEWGLDGPGGPGLPDWAFPQPYGGATLYPSWSQELPFGARHPINQYIAANGCVLVRVKLYVRTFPPEGGFVDTQVAESAGWQYP